MCPWHIYHSWTLDLKQFIWHFHWDVTGQHKPHCSIMLENSSANLPNSSWWNHIQPLFMLKTWVSVHSLLSPHVYKVYSVPCQEPPREIPPMTKVVQRRPDRQRWIRTQGIPWTCSSIYPKTKICLSTVYYIMPFNHSSDISRGLSLTTFLWRKST